jgi:hypothetical protein
MAWKDKSGYLVQWHQGKEVRQHRLIAESMLGRPLRLGEQVHHLNGVKDDNRPENLQVIDAATHTVQHWQEGHFADRVVAQVKPDCECPKCGMFGKPWAKGMCKPCYRRDYHETHREQAKQRRRERGKRLRSALQSQT